MNTAAKVAEDKKKFPERYCKEPRCLWKVMQTRKVAAPEPGIPDAWRMERILRDDCPGGRCPRHQRPQLIPTKDSALAPEKKSVSLDLEDFQ